MAEPTKFDPATREETWMFQEVNRGNGQKPTWRRLKFNLVSYDGIPEKYIEPVSEGVHVAKTSGSSDVRLLKPLTDHGRVADFEFVEGTAYPPGPEGGTQRFD